MFQLAFLPRDLRAQLVGVVLLLAPCVVGLVDQSTCVLQRLRFFGKLGFQFVQPRAGFVQLALSRQQAARFLLARAAGDGARRQNQFAFERNEAHAKVAALGQGHGDVQRIDNEHSAQQVIDCRTELFVALHQLRSQSTHTALVQNLLRPLANIRWP